MIDHAQTFRPAAKRPRRLARLPVGTRRFYSTGEKPIARSAVDSAAAAGAASKGSQRAQLMAAAASVVWFAGWFQAIYDEIAGHGEGER